MGSTVVVRVEIRDELRYVVYELKVEVV